MPNAFSSFVVFAEMRTGSNFLETNLNALDGVACLGEAFNPHFIGYPNQDDILGVTQAQREADPDLLMDAIRDMPGRLAGFRYFHDHDPRVLDRILADESCAKIILTRNPLDSYVSWKIAQATGQWKLTNIKARKAQKAVFEADEFSDHVAALQAFQVTLLNRLQASGQTAFYVAYEDLQSLEVMNGLANWLGVPARLEALDASLKPQNPEAITAKVENASAMEAALAGMDRFNLTRTPNFEPRRGPAVPGYYAGASAPLLFQPVDGGPTDAVLAWMASLDQTTAEGLHSKLNQKQLRQWKRKHEGFRSFSVIRHPVVRAHEVFCTRILLSKPQQLQQIRQTLKAQFKLSLPAVTQDGALQDYDVIRHREAFGQFLTFLKANLAGQTSVRVDSFWASQREIVTGFADVAAPDLVLREEELGTELPHLARRLGCEQVPSFAPAPKELPFDLSEIYDADIEEHCRAIYQRDYVTFGFGEWRPS